VRCGCLEPSPSIKQWVAGPFLQPLAVRVLGDIGRRQSLCAGVARETLHASSYEAMSSASWLLGVGREAKPFGSDQGGHPRMLSNRVQHAHTLGHDTFAFSRSCSFTHESHALASSRTDDPSLSYDHPSATSLRYIQLFATPHTFHSILGCLPVRCRFIHQRPARHMMARNRCNRSLNLNVRIAHKPSARGRRLYSWDGPL
jgi:hypothetical protein